MIKTACLSYDFWFNITPLRSRRKKVDVYPDPYQQQQKYKYMWVFFCLFVFLIGFSGIKKSLTISNGMLEFDLFPKKFAFSLNQGL